MAFAKTYQPGEYEPSIYKAWEESGLFAPGKKGEPFCIIMPPPNANGSLHWGHAIGYTLTDVITRYKRMQGYRMLWLPGTDHAGIETQFVYERDVLAPKGKNRLDFSPEKFYQDVMDFTLEKQGLIISQFRAMGFSPDWSRLKFTLDPDILRIVHDTFSKLHKDGHVYRGNRIVNWCPRCSAAFADIELQHIEREDAMYTIDYGPVRISTVRPETIFADVAVAVHPEDERYKDLIGKKAIIPLINRKIPIITDDYVDPETGTGALKITPGHDPNDYEVGLRHKLPEPTVIDKNGKMINTPQEFLGLSIEEARKAVVQELQSNGKLVSEEPLVHSVATHDRCGTVIEPLISEQWFLRISELNRPVIEAFEKEDVKVFPKRFKKVALNWLEREHDWCISRDSCWWGIRIPVYYKDNDDAKKNPYIIAATEDEAIKYYGKGNYRAETATFDTWFSSGQWPYATLMSTGKDDFKTYYPTDLMGTAREILHKWVTRMVMFGLYRTGEVPFKHVYLWGLVTDEHGKKMSKSKGNVIDPLKMTSEYGTDALRLAGTISNTAGTDSPMTEKRVEDMRNFANKLWNVSRFVASNIPEGYSHSDRYEAVTAADRWILTKLSTAIEEISDKIDQYRLNEAAYLLYHLVWDDFADWYIEVSKSEINLPLLIHSLMTILRLAHPFVPFVTEAIWRELPGDNGLLVGSSWPKPPKVKPGQENEFAKLQEIITEIRALRANLQLTSNWLYHTGSKLLSANGDLITRLTGINGVRQVKDGFGLHLISSDDVAWLDVEEQATRSYLFKLVRERDEKQDYLQSLKNRLDNKNYMHKAPKELTHETKELVSSTEQVVAKYNQQIESLEHSLQLYG